MTGGPKPGECWWVQRRDSFEPQLCQLLIVEPTVDQYGWFQIGHPGWMHPSIVTPLHRASYSRGEHA